MNGSSLQSQKTFSFSFQQLGKLKMHNLLEAEKAWAAF